MGEAGAEAFLRAHASEELCIAFIEDAAGELVFVPSPLVPLARVRRRPAAAPAVQIASAATLAAVLGACTPHGDPDQTIRVDVVESVDGLAPTTVIPAQAAPPPNPSEAASSPDPAEAEPCPPAVPTHKPMVKGRLKRKMGAKPSVRGPDLDPLG